jgi:hypothetical protein
VPTGWVAVSSRSGPEPATWTSKTGSSWSPAGHLSATAQLGSAATTTSTIPTLGATAAVTIRGVCAARVRQGSGPAAYAVTAVGSVVLANPGGTETTAAAAWTYEPGQGWRYATIGAAASPGTTAGMLGCTSTGAGLAAYGSAPAQGGWPAPAIWLSSDGIVWSRSNSSAFSGGTPNPLESLAAHGDYWVASGRPAAWVGPSPSLQNGREGLWLSSDAGSSWQAIDTFIDPWLGAEASELYLVGFRAGTPVIVGVEDGRLAVWTGI